MRRQNARTYTCLALAAFFGSAGVLHFTHTGAFAKIVPPPLPAELTVRVTGVIELLFAAGLAWPRTRARVGLPLALYCLAVLPANIHMALQETPVGGMTLPPSLLWLRVFLQLPLIVLILWATRACRSRSDH